MSHEQDRNGQEVVSVTPSLDSEFAVTGPAPVVSDERLAEAAVAPAEAPTESPEHSSDRLAALIDAGLRVEIDRLEQERLTRQGPLAGAD